MGTGQKLSISKVNIKSYTIYNYMLCYYVFIAKINVKFILLGIHKISLVLCNTLSLYFKPPINTIHPCYFCVFSLFLKSNSKFGKKWQEMKLLYFIYNFVQYKIYLYILHMHSRVPSFFFFKSIKSTYYELKYKNCFFFTVLK